MKRLIIILFSMMFLFTSCKKDNSIKYNGGDVVNIVLLEEFNLNASSNSKLTYHSDNESFVTVDNKGKIIGKNVGEANVTISNSTHSIVVKVIVSLFEEPTLDFGISQDEIRSLYGNPSHNYGDSIYVYGSGNNWYSYAVWEMDFFFIDDQYFESDLYIRSDLKNRIHHFLEDKYYYQNTLTDTIVNQDNEEIISTIQLYLNSPDANTADVMIGMQDMAGPYEDICVFYIPYYNDKHDYKKILSRDRTRRK